MYIIYFFFRNFFLYVTVLIKEIKNATRSPIKPLPFCSSDDDDDDDDIVANKTRFCTALLSLF